MKPLFFLLALCLVSGCAHKKGPDSHEARKRIDDHYTDRIGIATKAELVQEFGDAEWCRPSAGGEESCRFYNKKGTKWLGDKKDRKHYEAFDEILVDFDAKGTLKTFKSNAQR